jgi:hypothetical protein
MTATTPVVVHKVQLFAAFQQQKLAYTFLWNTFFDCDILG